MNQISPSLRIQDITSQKHCKLIKIRLFPGSYFVDAESLSLRLTWYNNNIYLRLNGYMALIRFINILYGISLPLKMLKNIKGIRNIYMQIGNKYTQVVSGLCVSVWNDVTIEAVLQGIFRAQDWKSFNSLPSFWHTQWFNSRGFVLKFKFVDYTSRYRSRSREVYTTRKLRPSA